MLLCDTWATSAHFCEFGPNSCIPGWLFALALLFLAFIVAYFLPRDVPSRDYPFSPHSCSLLSLTFCSEKINLKKLPHAH